MKYTRKQYRLGSTAIAAVIALTSTPLDAQEVPSTTDTPVEATTTVPEPTAPEVDPLAPAAEPEVTTEPAETTATTIEAEEAPAAAKPVAKKSATKTVRTVQRTAAKVAPVPTAVAPTAEPAIEAPAPVPAPMAAVEPTPEPVAEAQPAKGAELEEALPIAGGAGAVLLALAGAGMAVRRKRRKEDEEFEHHWLDNDELVLADEVDSGSQASWDPPVHTPKVVPMPATRQTKEIPDSFDTSGFGRHVKAAYEGPTPENPSLSLRKRLKIAGELDRRERLGLASKPVESSKPVTAAKPEKMAMSFGGTATQAKVREYQF